MTRKTTKHPLPRVKGQKVKSVDDMTLKEFCLHMTHRHDQQFSGNHGQPLFQSDYVWDLWLDHHDEDHAGGSMHRPKDKHWHAEPEDTEEEQ